MAMAAEIATDLAKGIASSVIDGVIQQLKDVVDLEEKLELLHTDFGYMKPLLLQIDHQFQEQERRLPEAIEVCLTRMSDHLTEGQQLINRANRLRKQCFGCCLLCNPNLFTQIRDWKIRFDKIFQELVNVFLISANTSQIVSAAAPQAELHQPVPDSGFVGSTIESAQKQLQEWVTQPHPQARMMGVYGMGGVGKTSLLKLVYNHFKEVSGVFDVVIWVTVSQNCQIQRLQASIAETLKLKTEGISDNDRLKMTLSASLQKKRFLLILDDMWRRIDLEEVGVKFGDHNCSKVLMSSRSREVIVEMGAGEGYSLKIQPLSAEEGWELFRTKAFTNGAAPRENIEVIARKIASECRGLPLALNVVAAAMRLKRTEDEWTRALNLMRSVDPSFRTSHSSIGTELYQRLRWSYDDLADPKLKICFLYCAVFPEDAQIDVETLVEMWSAEKLVTQMDAGHEYIDALVSRGLFEDVVHGYRFAEKSVKVHDVLRDLAIDIGRSEEKWLFGTDQDLQNFPEEYATRDCIRISVGHNDIQDLPTDPLSSNLVSLVLADNLGIREVPQLFLSTAMSLKVLDLSATLITSLPTSLGKLGNLELLKLSGCLLLEELPESTGNLSSLTFLHLDYCQSLNSLPDSIGDLRNLKHLNLQECDSLMVIPHGVSRLTSLNKLLLPTKHSWRMRRSPCAMRVKDLANLRNLIELEAVVKPEIKERTMTTWTEMRKLSLYMEDILPLNMENIYGASFDGGDVEEAFDGGDVEEDILPLNMENIDGASFDGGDVEEDILPLNMENIYGASFDGGDVEEDILPLNMESIYGASFDGGDVEDDILPLNMENIYGASFDGGDVEEDILPLNMENIYGASFDGGDVEEAFDGGDAEEDILPLNMENMKKLERFSLGNYEGVSLPDCISQYQNLTYLSFEDCPKLRALPACEIGNEIAGGGCPMLKELTLFNLSNLESIVTSEETMSELEEMHISWCRSLKRLGTKKLAALKRLKITDCGEFEALEIGSGGLPMLEALSLKSVGKFQITVGPAGVINDEVMPKLQDLEIAGCSSLKTLDKLSNLRKVQIAECDELYELEIGRGGFPMLQSLVLESCKNLESMVGPSDVWNEETMPRLEVLKIWRCRLLRRLPRGIEKLSKLKQIIGELEWWESIIWEDDNVKMKLSHLFTEY